MYTENTLYITREKQNTARGCAEDRKLTSKADFILVSSGGKKTQRGQDARGGMETAPGLCAQGKMIFAHVLGQDKVTITLQLPLIALLPLPPPYMVRDGEDWSALNLF